MKSCTTGWNPSKLGWNLRCITSDEIKSASINPALAGFHRVAISSTKWIYSDAGGFSWKSLRIVSDPEAFFGGVDGTCTRVRKHVPDAFYMLSLRLSFSPRRPQTGKRFEEVKMPLRFCRRRSRSPVNMMPVTDGQRTSGRHAANC